MDFERFWAAGDRKKKKNKQIITIRLKQITGLKEAFQNPEFSKSWDEFEKKYTFASAEISMVPQTMTPPADENHIVLMNKMLDLLEDNDDVQEVYHNFDAPDED